MKVIGATAGKMKMIAGCVLTALLLSASSSQHEDVITGELAFLEGEYEFIYSQGEAGRVVQPTELPDVYSLRITKKSDLFLLKNGKKFNKYSFSKVKAPLLKDNNYVMFLVGDTYYPMFYKGDTLHTHALPIEFNENYFVKRK